MFVEGESVPCPREQSYQLAALSNGGSASVLVACSSCAPVATPQLFELHSDCRALDQRARLDEQLLELA